MQSLTVTASITGKTSFDHHAHDVLDEVGVVGHDGGTSFGIWATDPDDLERLAAECIAAANALREKRARIAGAA